MLINNLCVFVSRLQLTNIFIIFIINCVENSENAVESKLKITNSRAEDDIIKCLVMSEQHS